jgi:hypothetical protein
VRPIMSRTDEPGVRSRMDACDDVIGDIRPDQS